MPVSRIQMRLTHFWLLKTGKEIAEDAALLIASLTENHPYYAQQLAQLSWLRTERLCSVSVVREAHESLIAQFSLIFSAIVDETHTTQQVRFLKALLDGAGSLTATEVLKRYQIASATSVARSKEALLKKDILDKNGPSLAAPCLTGRISKPFTPLFL